MAGIMVAMDIELEEESPIGATFSNRINHKIQRDICHYNPPQNLSAFSGILL